MNPNLSPIGFNVEVSVSEQRALWRVGFHMRAAIVGAFLVAWAVSLLATRAGEPVLALLLLAVGVLLACFSGHRVYTLLRQEERAERVGESRTSDRPPKTIAVVNRPV